jgi:hypothetical protein
MKTVLWVSCVVALLFAGFAGISAYNQANLIVVLATSFDYLMWAIVMGLFAMHHEKSGP